MYHSSSNVPIIDSHEHCALGWFKKTRFWGNQLLFHFLNLYVEQIILPKAVACTMIFNPASTMTNLSLNSQNLSSCSQIGLFVRFLVFHSIKISFVKPEVREIIFSTASPVFKFIKKWNWKLKMFYMLLLTQPLSSFLWVKRKQGVNEQQRIQQFFFRYFINLNTGEAVLNIIVHASGFTKFIFMW